MENVSPFETIEEVARVVLSSRFTDPLQVVTGSTDQTAHVWEMSSGPRSRCCAAMTITSARHLASGKKKDLEGHTSPVTAVALNEDGSRLFSCGSDGTIRLWDTASGKETCKLWCFPDGTWAVIDAAGRYDAANAGDVVYLSWIVGDERLPVRRFRERSYDPGLLAKHLGLSKQRLKVLPD